MRVPWLLPAHPVLVGEAWPSYRWGNLGGINYLHHPDADPSVVVPPMGFLTTGGRLVVNRGLRGATESTPSGDHLLVAKARLPLGAAAGRYALEVLDASQVLLEDGNLVRPVINGDSEIIVAEEVAVGWSRALPPLRFDVAERRVLGKIEFRFANRDGIPAPEGEPLLEARLGEAITFRVQIGGRTP